MKLANPVRFQPKALTYIFVVVFFLVGSVYVFTVNKVANKGTALNTLSQGNKELYAENARLETEAARLAALVVIDQNVSGAVETGDQESRPTPVPGQPDGAEAEVQAQEISMATPAQPKLVQIKSQTYLPSYASMIAQR